MLPQRNLDLFFRSKLDLYKILTVDSKYANGNCLIENYLQPSYKQCPLEFIMQLIASENKCTVKDECDIGMYSRLRSFCSLYGWRPRNFGYTVEFQLLSMSVPHPRLPSHLHLQSPPDQNPVENELPKLEIGLA